MTRHLARSSSLVLLAVALAALAPSVAFAAGEINGRISGYVYDPTGAPLAEVPLTLSGPALQKPMTTTSSDSGRYEFTLVPPGRDYTVEVNVPGFTPIKQTGITVLLDKSTPVDVHLSVLTETQAVQTYEIVEKVNPIINPDSAQQGAVITSEKAVATPTFQQVEGMPQQVMGVGPGNRPSTRGGLARYTKFYVDGMDTTDITEGNITAPLNFLAVENFDVVTGGYDAQYNALGVVENVFTKTGSNKFTYDVQVIAAPSFLTAKNKIPSGQPDYATFYVNNDQPGPQTTFYSPVFALGGPIIKDKLWFYLSGQINFSNRESPITQGTQFYNRNTKTTTSLGRLKLTWQATSADRLSVALNLDHNTIDNLIGSSTVTNEAEGRIDRGGYFIIVNYDHSFTDNLLFQLQTGTTYKIANQDPESIVLKDVDPDAISHRDVSGGITYFNAGSISASLQGNYVHEYKNRFQFDPTLIWKKGSHQLKGGVQFALLADTQTTGVRGNQRYLDRGGICDPNDPTTFGFCNQRVDFYNVDGTQTPLTTKALVQTYGAFIQDRWTVNRQLTVVPGFRVDTGRLYDSSGNLASILTGVGPRLSATYDLFGNRKDLFVAAYGRSNDVGDVTVAQHANPALLQVISNWNGNSANPNAFAPCDPQNVGPGCTLSGGLTGRQFAAHQRPPNVDEVTLGYRHGLDNGVVLGVDATYRNYGHMWADEEINRIFDSTGTRIIGYVNGQPQSILQAETPASAYRRYAGLDLWAQGVTGPWDILVGYTLSYNWGTVSDYFDGYLNNPRLAPFFDGWLPDDQRHTIKGSISYTTPFGFDIGARIQYRSGKPMWESFPNPADSSQRLYRSPRGTGFATNTNTGLPDFNDPSTWTELRTPTQSTLDLQARYDLGRAIGLKQQKLELSLLVVNVLNNTDPFTIQDQWATRGVNRFGQVISRQGPQQAEVIVRFRN